MIFINKIIDLNLTTLRSCITLSKYKPRIADKLASARNTGGGEAETCLDELEAKISSINLKVDLKG